MVSRTLVWSNIIEISTLDLRFCKFAHIIILQPAWLKTFLLSTLCNSSQIINDAFKNILWIMQEYEQEFYHAIISGSVVRLLVSEVNSVLCSQYNFSSVSFGRPILWSHDLTTAVTDCKANEQVFLRCLNSFKSAYLLLFIKKMCLKICVLLKELSFILVIFNGSHLIVLLNNK